ncbi:MAG: putative secreted protein associated with spyDAC [Candidatus Jettenia ecosi]|uniref:Putative secreted protein associated with spyDAC n=1 Tax=Candidatus Jettenia ecosi TaxID=2494326 RepID=A0A533Q814_9BACT|nr:MAG: putative secreted protein associated with spyDAC [Candidatus Jettenia ecosi]
MIKKIFTGNILTKLMALVMAVALWLYAINRHTGDVTEVVKLNILVPHGVAIVEQDAEEITIHLRGPQNIIDGLTSMIKEQKIQATYTIEESRTEIEDQEKQTILISREHLNIPNDVKLMGLYPDKVDVVLSKLQQKRLKVNIQKKGEPAIGYSVANEFVFPSEIEVTGPLNTLKEASSINTVPVDIDGITIEQNRTFPWRIGIDKKITVTRGDKSISVPVECKEDVRVWLQIVEQQDTKFFEKIKIKVMSPADYPYEIKLQDEFTNIKVKGPKLVLDKLNNENILLYIDVTSLKPPGPYKQPIKYVLPKNVELFDKLPEAHLDIRETAR